MSDQAFMLDARWIAKPPCGHHIELTMPPAQPHHEVEEHEDGTVSIEPRPSNSNSVLCYCGWHGYVAHDVWRKA